MFFMAFTFIFPQQFAALNICQNLLCWLVRIFHRRMDLSQFIPLPIFMPRFVFRLRPNTSESDSWITIFLLENVIVSLSLQSFPRGE